METAAEVEARAGSRDRRDACVVLALALVTRVAVALWAAPRFPPADDGVYYERIAERIASGHGYTWVWPDGAVTFAAHYPVGYPALLAAVYALVGGPSALAAMLLHAALGAIGALAVHRLAARVGSPATARVAGLLVALHPGLVLYTPALMTEGVTAALLAIAVWLAAITRDRDEARRRPWLALAAMGLVLGAATLVRPQIVLVAPALGLLAARTSASLRKKLAWAALATGLTLAVCAPWTARNCVRMHRCALVSVNGGWNLLIGADPASTGAWSPIQVPEACRTVWDEAAKDACFGREARRFIVSHPLSWLSLVPRKLAATFDYTGAAGYYLHASNPHAFGERAKLALGAIETILERGVLLVVLLALARSGGRRTRGDRVRLAIAAVGMASALFVHGFVAWVALAALLVARGRELLRAPVLVSASAAALVATIATHAIFFGAGRYSLLVVPLVTGLVACRRAAPSATIGAPADGARTPEGARGL
jgi:4-amino-4-deoxy-L-arabinose transferase-like glycosyltransferase